MMADSFLSDLLKRTMSLCISWSNEGDECIVFNFQRFKFCESGEMVDTRLLAQYRASTNRVHVFLIL